MSAASPAQPRRLALHWLSAWLLLGLLLGAQALRMRVAEAAVNASDGPQAIAIRPQNGWGHALVAQLQLAHGGAKAAMSSSREALKRTPLSVAAIRTLARSLDSTRPGGAGERAWQVASSLGWRDRPTQLWALLRALANGEAQVFVIRADALMRVRPDDPQLAGVFRQALLHPAIRGPFVQRLAREPKWRLRLFVSDQPLAGRELDGTVRALHALGSTPTPPTRAELRAPLLGLILAGRYAEALALDRQFVRRAPHSGSLIDDGGFELAGVDYKKDTTPFDWMISGTSATVDQSGGRRSIVINTAGSYAKRALERYVPLPAGAYRLEYSINGPADAPASIGVRAFCAAAVQPLATSSTTPLPSETWHRRALEFRVHAGCPVTRLVIGALDRAETREALIDDVRIVQLSR